MKLTRAQWEELIHKVFERDLYQAWLRSEDRLHHHVSFRRWRTNHQAMACVARFLDPITSGPCSGRLTFDHVHERGQTALQMKAKDDERHLQTVCEWHHGTSRTGGGWATSKRARGLSRDYLTGLYPAAAPD